ILPLIAVINVSEGDIGGGSAEKWLNGIKEKASKYPNQEGLVTILLSGKIEMEIAQLSPEEAVDFLRDLGVKEPARDRLIHESYRLLGLISFLTPGED
mgnify:CR=1